MGLAEWFAQCEYTGTLHNKMTKIVIHVYIYSTYTGQLDPLQILNSDQFCGCSGREWFAVYAAMQSTVCRCVHTHHADYSERPIVCDILSWSLANKRNVFMCGPTLCCIGLDCQIKFIHACRYETQHMYFVRSKRTAVSETKFSDLHTDSYILIRICLFQTASEHI